MARTRKTATPEAAEIAPEEAVSAPEEAAAEAESAQEGEPAPESPAPAPEAASEPLPAADPALHTTYGDDEGASGDDPLVLRYPPHQYRIVRVSNAGWIIEKSWRRLRTEAELLEVIRQEREAGNSGSLLRGSRVIFNWGKLPPVRT